MATDGDKIAAATLASAYLTQYWSVSSNPKSDPVSRAQMIRDVAEFYREMLIAVQAAAHP
jgi:hypothetical protein